MPSSAISISSKCTVYPHRQSTEVAALKLSVSDVPMLSCHYIQKGVLLTTPPYSTFDLMSSLKESLSVTLSHFPPLAGRLATDSGGAVHIICNDAGVLFVEAKAKTLSVQALLSPLDVPEYFKEFFVFDKTLSYSGHSLPLAAVQVTELADGVFIGCTVNHAVTDGTSFWHFFNTFAAVCGGAEKIAKSPDFGRDTVFNSKSVLQFPAGGPTATFSGEEPLRERIFHFSREAILKLKQRANSGTSPEKHPQNGFTGEAEILGKQNNDNRKIVTGENHISPAGIRSTAEISSFQSLCAHLWRSVTRARKLEQEKTTTFRMAVNCRHRLKPRLDPYYFGNAIQSIPTISEVGKLLSSNLRWCAYLLHQNVVAHDDLTVRRGIEDWERSPRLFPLGNFDGASITMGSSPRFPMYENDFGWGRPLAVRSGRANKFDGKISAFPGRGGNGSVDLEVVLSPETMAGIESDSEFMQYVSVAE